MFPEEGYFYVTQDELNARSYDPRLRGKPLAFVFFEMIKSLAGSRFESDFQFFELSRVQNFYNKVSEDGASWELCFSDNSYLVFRGNEFKAYHPSSGFSQSLLVL